MADNDCPSTAATGAEPSATSCQTTTATSQFCVKCAELISGCALPKFCAQYKDKVSGECILCLGLLTNGTPCTLHDRLLEQIHKRLFLDVSDFSVNISIPIEIVGRFHEFNRLANASLNPKETLRFMLIDIVRQEFEKATGHAPVFDTDSPFSVRIGWDLSAPLIATKQKKYGHTKQQHGKRRKLGQPPTSTIEKLEDADDDENREVTKATQQDEQQSLQTVVDLPAPISCNCSCRCWSSSLQVAFHREATIIEGRYKKFSRVISQTPWIIDGERKTKHSVEDLICDALSPFFEPRGRNFYASGREDMDVRMLGSGRPFVVELQNCRSIIPRAPEGGDEAVISMQQLEKRVNEAIQRAWGAEEGLSQPVEVLGLRMDSKTRREAYRQKQREAEEKKKSYGCICWCEKHLDHDDIAVLSSVTPLTVKQATPLRVLHRRTAAIRPKEIYALKATLLGQIPTQWFALELETEAGTYIKEFVHGDFGRCTPSVTSLLARRTEVHKLDVLDLVFEEDEKEKKGKKEEEKEKVKGKGERGGGGKEDESSCSTNLLLLADD